MDYRLPEIHTTFMSPKNENGRNHFDFDIHSITSRDIRHLSNMKKS